MRKHTVVALFVLVSLLLSACAAPTPAAPQIVRQTEIVEKPVVVTPTAEPVKLTILTHYSEESVLKPFEAKLDEYRKLHPNVTIEHETVTFDQLLAKIITGRAAGISLDIYHFYDLWLPDFVSGGMLAAPTDDVVADTKANYSQGSVDAVSYKGQVWGYPTEINIYQLLYNKKMLQEAGYSKPPETWDELKDMSAKITQVDGTGKVTRAGFLLMPGWDSGVVHPYLSLLWSNGGEYLSPDGTKCLVDQPASQDTLQLYMDLLRNKGTDLSVSGWDFTQGSGAMIIMANWWRADLEKGFKDGYENVGVAPIPHSANGKSTALQYNWMFGVDNNSKYRKEAWDLVQWLNSPASEGAASPMGDYLMGSFGALPSRLSDQKALADRFDPFMQAFINGAASAKPEPIVRGGQEVKTLLQTELEAAWYGKKAPDAALKNVAEEGSRILTEKQ